MHRPRSSWAILAYPSNECQSKILGYDLFFTLTREEKAYNHYWLITNKHVPVSQITRD